LDPDIRAALESAWSDGSWGQYLGRHGSQLEHAQRDYLQIDHVLLCGSGTFAVELGLRVLGVEAGDEVILAAYDYPGNFLSVHALGAMPVLVDVEPGNWNMAVSGLKQAIGPKTKAIIVSHLHGGIVPMRGLMALARDRGVKVVEDAAQCPGAIVDGKKAGTWGDIGVISFGGSKLLSAGRGGALFTSQADLAQRARTYLQRGNNLVCPLSELQAAALWPQLAKLDQRNDQRLAAVEMLRTLLADVPGLRFFTNAAGQHRPGYYKVGFQFDTTAFGLPRERLVTALRAEGIAIDEGFAALHVGRSPRRFRAATPLTDADRAHRGVVMLHHPVLLEGPEALEQVVAAWRKLYHHRELLTSEGERRGVSLT
jgi:dTDP-4-amino-4,6-dideoxygalactose transaminase